MLVPLIDAEASTCGHKAAALATLLRAGVQVPDGAVVPIGAHRSDALVDMLGAELGELASVPVAVRSSASTEDVAGRSAAGQHDSVLGVVGAAGVAAAVRQCWASLRSARAESYRMDDPAMRTTAMAVLIQRLVDADISGVMFTPTHASGETRIEASWGLGTSTAGGTTTPDAYAVGVDGSIRRSIAHKRTREDREGARLRTTEVEPTQRDRPSLDDVTVVRLAALGSRVAGILGAPQDVEWAIAGDRLWIVQARPVTADLPAQPPDRRDPAVAGETILTGSPGSAGTASGPARVVIGPDGFPRVRSGDILVCRTTDPAWTPLLRVVAGVVTEVGGVLSHAAIVARERGIPAVLGAAGATTRLRDGEAIVLDGGAGTVTATERRTT